MNAIDNIRAAQLYTRLDFIFLFFYSLLLFYLCKELAGLTAGFLRKAGRFLATGALVAGLLDIFENAGMLLSLNGNITDALILLTFICSLLKWLLVLVAVLYLLIAGPVILYKKRRKA